MVPRDGNLVQGQSELAISPDLASAAAAEIAASRNHYSPAEGTVILREAVAKKIAAFNGLVVDPDARPNEFLITHGGTGALVAICHTYLKNASVLVFEPYYPYHTKIVEEFGGATVPFPLSGATLSLDVEGLRARCSELVRRENFPLRAIIVCTPVNPTGKVFTRHELESIAEICEEFDLLCISDEVYEHLIFDGKKHESMLRYPDLYDRSFVCFSFGKVYHCTGWKLGYCIAPPQLMKEFRKVHQFNCFTCNSPAQFALAEFLQQKENYLQLGNFLQKKRDHFLNLMQQTKFKPLPSFGSYFQLYSYAAVSDESEKDFAIRLTKEYGVATIPTSAFYKDGTDNKVLRFCFAKKESTQEEAANRLIKL